MGQCQAIRVFAIVASMVTLYAFQTNNYQGGLSARIISFVVVVFVVCLFCVFFFQLNILLS